MLLAGDTAATVAELITAINNANQSNQADTITLAAGATFSLTAPSTVSTGLPAIATGSGHLTILGNGATIERSAAPDTPPFRLFEVFIGASLTLRNLTLQGGLALGGVGGEAAGGAIAGPGPITLEGCTLQNNMAQGEPGSRHPWTGQPFPGRPAYGGAIAGGSLTMI